MMDVSKVFGLLVIVFVCCVQTGQSDDIFDTRKESGMRWIMNRLAARPELIRDFKEQLEIRLDTKIQMEPQLELYKDNTNCINCKVIVGIIKFLTGPLGLGYENKWIRMSIIGLCKIVMGAETDGETMCTPLMDNYAHHVTFILKETNRMGMNPMSPMEICVFLNQCEDREDVSTTTSGQTNEPTTKQVPTEGQTDEPTTEQVPTEGHTNEPTTKQVPTEGQTDEPTTKQVPTEGQTNEPTTKLVPTEGQTDEPTTKQVPPEGQTDEPTTEQVPPEGQPDEPAIKEMFGKPFLLPFPPYGHMSSTQFWKEKNNFINQIISSQPMSISRKKSYGAKLRHKRHLAKMENAIKIAQVTDFHVDEKYAEGGAVKCDLPVCCRNDSNGDGSASKWGEAAFCNIPPHTTELFLEFVKGLNPDFVIYSGDNPPHSAWEETQENQIHISKWAAQSVEKIITTPLEIRAYPAIGNHEPNPTNLYSMVEDVHGENMKEFNREWSKSWELAAGFGPEQNETIMKAGYYSIPVEMKSEKEHKLRIVCFNSNYGYTDNFYNLIHKDRAEFNEMCTWLVSTLKEARANNEKVILLTHHDVGSFENIIEFDEWFTKVLADFNDIIILHPVGHTHRDEFRLFFKDEDYSKPAGIVHVAMTMNSWPQVNPGFRVFYIDKDDYRVLDYDQYYINLTAVPGGAEKPEPVLLYTFTEEYGVKDASAASYMDLWRRMKTDRKLMLKFWYNRRLMSMADPEMSDEQWKSELCHGIGQSYGRYRECMRDGIVIPEEPTTEATHILTTESGSSVPKFAMTIYLWMVVVNILT